MRLSEFQSNYVGPIVYHGSKIQGLDLLEPRMSNTAGAEVVFAATLLDIAIAMAGHWTDDDFEFGREGQEVAGRMIPYSLKELRPGAIEKFFSEPTYVYFLPSDGFTNMEGLQDFELASLDAVEPISYIVIDSPMDFIRNSPLIAIQRYSDADTQHNNI